MASEQFSGIDAFHDGERVKDYQNMIPLGDKCIDRVGESLITGYTGSNDAKIRGWFKDSLGNVYVVDGTQVFIHKFGANQFGHATLLERRAMRFRAGNMSEPGENSGLLTATGECTFAESSTKPSQVYMCDGKYLYWWNTSEGQDQESAHGNFVVNMLPRPNEYPIAVDDGFQDLDMRRVYTGMYGEVYDISQGANIDWIDWIDNKLVLTQKEANTVWLTSTDPTRFFRYGSVSVPYQYQIANEGASSVVKDSFSMGYYPVPTAGMQLYNDWWQKYLNLESHTRRLWGSVSTTTTATGTAVQWIDTDSAVVETQSTSSLMSYLGANVHGYYGGNTYGDGFAYGISYKNDAYHELRTRFKFDAGANIAITVINILAPGRYASFDQSAAYVQGAHQEVSYVNISLKRVISQIAPRIGGYIDGGKYAIYTTGHFVPNINYGGPDQWVDSGVVKSGTFALPEEKLLEYSWEELAATVIRTFDTTQRESAPVAVTYVQDEFDPDILHLTIPLASDFGIQQSLNVAVRVSFRKGSERCRTNLDLLCEDLGLEVSVVSVSVVNGSYQNSTVLNKMYRQVDVGGVSEVVSDLWTNWYHSTASNDNLNRAVAFQGVLYLMNEHSIEPWSVSGDEDNPITPNTLKNISIGGRTPFIYQDTLYFIGITQHDDEFLVGLSNDGMRRLSNEEVERNLGRVTRICAISMRDDTYIMLRCDQSEFDWNPDSYCLTLEGRWWRFCENIGTKTEDGTVLNGTRQVIASINNKIALTNTGAFVRFNPDSRKMSNGNAIVRYIRDCFKHFQTRRIINEVRLIMDTGREANNMDGRANQVYLTCSMDRGYSFGPRQYRTCGKAGDNDRYAVWRRLGSCNSLVIEFGTSAQFKLQIYGVVIVDA